MAKVTLLPALVSVSGQVGNLIFRNVRGRTFISSAPVHRRIKPTPAQLESRERFQQAASYGRMALADPVRRAFYTQLAVTKNKPIFALAIQDYFQAPQVDQVDVAA